MSGLLGRGGIRKLAFVAPVMALLLFKFRLVSLGGTGIRPEDVAVAVATMLMALGGGFRSYRPDRIDIALWTFVAVQILSAIVGGMFGSVNPVIGLLYAIRPLEYWLVRPLLEMSGASRVAGRRVLKLFLWLSVALSALQLSGIPIGDSAFAYTRASGNTNGPYELAAVAAGLLLFFWRRGQISWACLAVVCLIASASRITTVAVIVVLVAGRVKGSARLRALQRRGRFILMAGFVALLMAGSVVLSGGGRLSVAKRLEGSSPVAAWNSAGQIISSDPVAKTQAEYVYLAYTRFQDSQIGIEGSNSSGLIRFVRWRTLLRSWVQSPQTFVFGLGPSFAGVAVDGYFVRVAVESGALGLCALGSLLWALLSGTEPGSASRRYIYVLVVSALFIDILVSSKAVILLWFILWAEPCLASAEYIQRRGTRPILKYQRQGMGGW